MSPVVSTQWAIGQQGNETNVREALVGDGNGGAEQASVVGDGANVNANGGTVQESAVDDGAKEDGTDTGIITTSEQRSVYDNGDEVETNQERKSIVEDGIAIGKADSDSSAATTDGAADIRERALEKRRAMQTFERSILLANSTQISTTQNGYALEQWNNEALIEAIEPTYDGNSPNGNVESESITNSDMKPFNLSSARSYQGTRQLSEITPVTTFPQFSNQTVALPEFASTDTQSPSLLVNQSTTPTEKSLPLVDNSSTQITPSFQSITGGENNPIENESAITNSF